MDIINHKINISDGVAEAQGGSISSFSGKRNVEEGDKPLNMFPPLTVLPTNSRFLTKLWFLAGTYSHVCLVSF